MDKARQKRDAIAERLKQTPHHSDRQIAALVGVSDKTVGAVRRELEATAEIAPQTKRVGGDGRARGRRLLLHSDAISAVASPSTEEPLAPSVTATPSPRQYGYTCPDCGGHKLWQDDCGHWYCWGCYPPSWRHRAFQVIDYGRPAMR